MSNDPLALSVLTVGPPRETDYDAVYAAVTTTERGRWFLSQYAKRNRHADTELIVAAIARLEARLCGDATPQPSAVTSADLTAIAAIIERVRAAFAAAGPQMSAVGNAAERISDISFSLRERSVDAALCNALDAAAREISEACANSAADEDRAGNAAESLRELVGRLDALLKVSAADPVSSDVLGSISSETSSAVSSQVSMTDAVTSPAAYAANPERPARAPAADGPRWHIEGPDFAIAPTHRKAEQFETEPAGESDHFHALLPETELQPRPQGVQDTILESSITREVVAPDSPPASAAATPVSLHPAPAEEAHDAKAASPQLRIANAPAAGDVPSPVPIDPLAAIRSLGDDEMIALFG